MVSFARTFVLVLSGLALCAPSASALGGLDVPLLVRDLDEAVAGTVHGVLVPLEAPAAPDTAPAPASPPASAAPPARSSGDDLGSTGSTSAPAPIATLPQPSGGLALWPWVVTLGAAFVGLGASAMRGPLSRVRNDGFAVFWRALLGGALLVTTAVLLYADWSALASGPAWVAFTALAWVALLVGALAVRAIGTAPTSGRAVGQVHERHA